MPTKLVLRALYYDSVEKIGDLEVDIGINYEDEIRKKAVYEKISFFNLQFIQLKLAS